MHLLMRNAGRLFLCCTLTAGATLVHAQGSAPAKPAVGTVVAPAQVYGKLLSSIEKEFVGAAEAMPEDKFGFAPTAAIGEFKGVRTFGEQVKHVADANWYFFGDPKTTEAEGKAKSDAIGKLNSKAEIVQALKESFVQAHTFVDGITSENAFVTLPNGGTRGGMAALGIAHMMDHYGQMAEYLRMNGIVPPASRGSM
jgi:uncharacterized damage-inducible protein DinB